MSALVDSSKEIHEIDAIKPVFDFIATLDSDEIREAVGILGRDADKTTMVGLEGRLIAEWVKKDPAAALNYYADRLMKPGFQCNTILQQGLAVLARTDFPKAQAWLDALTARGGFDNTSIGEGSNIWVSYKAALVHGGMLSNPDLVAVQIEGCNRSERSYLFTSLTIGLKEEEQAAYSQLCRRFLDPDVALSKIVSLCDQTPLGQQVELEEVSRMFDRIQATPQERSTVATNVSIEFIVGIGHVRDFTPGDIASFREWVKKQGVKTPDRLTGNAIGGIPSARAGQLDLAFEILENYRREGAGEALVYAFLRHSSVWKREDDCRALLETLHNEAWKKEILADAAPKKP